MSFSEAFVWLDLEMTILKIFIYSIATRTFPKRFTEQIKTEWFPVPTGLTIYFSETELNGLLQQSFS